MRKAELGRLLGALSAREAVSWRRHAAARLFAAAVPAAAAAVAARALPARGGSWLVDFFLWQAFLQPAVWAARSLQSARALLRVSAASQSAVPLHAALEGAAFAAAGGLAASLCAGSPLPFAAALALGLWGTSLGVAAGCAGLASKEAKTAVLALVPVALACTPQAAALAGRPAPEWVWLNPLSALLQPGFGPASAVSAAAAVVCAAGCAAAARRAIPAALERGGS